MKNLFKTGGIGVVILTLICMSFFLSCCSKKNMSDILVQPDTNLVTFDSVKDMNQQIIVLKQFDSLSQIIQKQSRLIDSLSKTKTKIIYSDKMIYKEKARRMRAFLFYHKTLIQASSHSAMNFSLLAINFGLETRLSFPGATGNLR